VKRQKRNLELNGAVSSHSVTASLAYAVDGVEEKHLAAKGGDIDDQTFLVLCHYPKKRNMESNFLNVGNSLLNSPDRLVLQLCLLFRFLGS